MATSGPTYQPLSACGWTARAVGDLSHMPAPVRARLDVVGGIPATVPGCIHTDLIDAGLIPDPAIGEHEKEVQWVSWTDWRYETRFEAYPELFDHHEIDLVFECLDTIAAIELNGDKVGNAASEFMPHRFSVLGLLKPGTNHLAVTLTSPLRYVHEQAAKLGPRPVNGDWDPFVFIRKCASNFQWDWGPKVATCGIAADVRLDAWSVLRLLPTTVEVSDGIEPGTPGLTVKVPLKWSAQANPNASVLLYGLVTHANGWTGRDGGAASPPRAGSIDNWRSELFQLVVDLDRAEPWWPRGHGQRSLYTLNVEARLVDPACREVSRATSALLDGSTTRFGLRDVAWSGGGFRINDRPILCKGANWIPEGLWPRDRTPERVRRRLQQLVAANMNMLRVWGGGRYEPDWFYDLCDEMGIMVWQDFMFSSGMYPEEDPYPALIEAEARHQVARLSRHPSVVLWCGGNECTWAYESWGWKDKLKPGQTWGRKYWLDLLPKVVSELDPTRPYWPNSPWSGDESKPNDTEQGDRHTWDVWGDGYRAITPRFCSEFGQQAPSNYGTLRGAGLTPDLAPFPGREARGRGDAGRGVQASSPSPPVSQSPSLLLPASLASRQRGPGGNKRWYDDPIAELFRPPRDFDEWHFLAQLLQARSLRTGIEWLRTNQPRCSGALIWQLNDAWPGLSWSIIDSAGRRKLAYYAVQESFKPRLLTIQPIDNRPQLFAINDTQERASYILTIRRIRLDGEILAKEGAQRLAVQPHSVSQPIDLEPLIGSPSDPTREFLVADALGHRATWFYLPDKLLRYPDVNFDAHEFIGIGNRGGKARAGTVIRDLVFRTDVLPLDKDDALYVPTLRTFLPGEEITFEIGNPTRADLPPPAASEIFSRPFLWCANWFGASEP